MQFYSIVPLLLLRHELPRNMVKDAPGVCWSRIVEWQEDMHIEKCRRILLAYEEATSYYSPSPEVEVIKNALREAIKSAEMRRRGYQATASDAYQIHDIFDEPALRQLIESDKVGPSVKQRFRDLEAYIIQGQPMFPPGCDV